MKTSNRVLAACGLGLLLQMGIAQRAHALSDPVPVSPGNIFVEGKIGGASFNVTFTGSLSYAFKDFWGSTVHSSTATGGSAAIAVPTTLKAGWYRLHLTETNGTQVTQKTMSLGVVLDRNNAPLSATGRVCADAASAWYLPKKSTDLVDKKIDFSKMVRLAGIPRVRERFGWKVTEGQNDQFYWPPHLPALNQLEANGVLVDAVWLDTPDWAKTKPSSAPNNFLDVYDWSKHAAAQHSSPIASWEVWNEADSSLPTWVDTADLMAAYQKAAYWGIKDGNPNADVLLGSMAANPAERPASRTFASNLFDSGVTDYYDKFNWHTYNDPSDYAARYAAHREIQQFHNVPQRPAWITEAGTRLDSDVPNSPRLADPELKEQARFVPRSVTMSFAAGNEKHFFFILPNFGESRTQFGALETDLTPRPSFVALSAAANLLGESTYRGKFTTGISGVEAHLFSTTNHGNILVAWSTTADNVAVSVPITSGTTSVTKSDFFGAKTNVAASGTTASVILGKKMEATYISGIGNAILSNSNLTAPAPTPTAAAPNPSRVVIASRALLPVHKEQNTYVHSPSQKFTYAVDVYNFHPTNTYNGSVSLNLPQGWTCATMSKTANVPAMERVQLQFEITPNSLTDMMIQKVRVKGTYSGQNVADSVSYFLPNPAAITPNRVQKMNWYPQSRWDDRPVSASSNATAYGVFDVDGVAEALEFQATFSSGTDSWFYPTISFPDEGLNLSTYDGMAFDLNTIEASTSATVQMMLVDSNGGTFLTGTTIKPGSGYQRVVLLFKDFMRAAFAPGTQPIINLKNIKAAKIGCNITGGSIKFQVRNIQAVDLPLDPSVVPPTNSIEIPELNAATGWIWNTTTRSTTCTNSTAPITSLPSGASGFRYAATFSSSGTNNWAYPYKEWSTPKSFSGYDGIGFELTTNAPVGTSVGVMLFEAFTGATYLATVPVRATPENERTVVLRFRDFKLADFSPPDSSLDISKIRAFRIGCSGSGQNFSFDIKRIRLVDLPGYDNAYPTATRNLDWLPASTWSNYSSSPNTVTVADITNGLQFITNFPAAGGNWAQPFRYYSNYLESLVNDDALEFDLDVTEAPAGTTINIMLVEANGASWITTIPYINAGTQHIVWPLSEFKWGSFSAADSNGLLDLDKVRTLRIGCNTPGKVVNFKVRNLQAVTLPAQ